MIILKWLDIIVCSLLVREKIEIFLSLLNIELNRFNDNIIVYIM